MFRFYLAIVPLFVWNDGKSNEIVDSTILSLSHLWNCSVSHRYHHKISHFIRFFLSFFFLSFFTKTLTINNVITYQFDCKNGFVRFFDLHALFNATKTYKSNLFYFSRFYFCSVRLLIVLQHTHTHQWFFSSFFCFRIIILRDCRVLSESCGTHQCHFYFSFANFMCKM